MQQRELQPYVGPRPYDEQDRALFFGREYETSELASLVVAHPVVLVYAASGAGKTSLVQAGLIPALREGGFELLAPARVHGRAPPERERDSSVNPFALNVLLSWSRDSIGAGNLVSGSLAEFLRRLPRQKDDEGMARPRAIVLDQLEELFTTHPERWADRLPFLEQLGAALDDRLLRVVLVMREDSIAWVDRYADAIPGRLRVRFHLELLGKDAALVAIKRPLENTQRSFAPGVAEKLTEDLARIRVGTETGETHEVAGQYIEPVQLQLVCQRLWQDLPSDVREITGEHIKAFGDVGQTLIRFYEQSIRAAVRQTGVKEGELREWFGRELITSSGTRARVFYGSDRTGTIPNTAVDVLEGQYIIRREIWAGGRWYELTHDRLIEPILASNMRWTMSRPPSKAVREAYKALSQVYGFAYDYQRLTCTVHRDGSATVERHCKLVGFSNVSKFIIYLLLPERAKQTAGEAPTFTEVNPPGTSLAIDRQVSKASPNSYIVDIDPPLTAGDWVTFRVLEDVNQKVFVTQENPKPDRKKDFDYVCWDIFHPTARLEIAVDLPSGVEFARPEVDVWYAMSGSEIRHEKEFDRVRTLIHTNPADPSRIEFAVDNPIFSLSYVVRWTPQIVSQGPTPS